MIHFKSHKKLSGFVLAEVMLALFMLGSVVSSVMVLQQVALKNIGYFSHRFEYIVAAKQLLMQAWYDREQQEKETTSLKKEQQGATISYSVKEPAQNSALKTFEHIALEQVRAQWNEGIAKKEVMLLSLLYKPEKPKA